jgi:hypothetical protein
VGFDATANTASFEPSPNLNPNSGSLVLNSGCLCGMRKNGGAATKSSGKVWGGTIFSAGGGGESRRADHAGLLRDPPISRRSIGQHHVEFVYRQRDSEQRWDDAIRDDAIGRLQRYNERTRWVVWRAALDSGGTVIGASGFRS